MFLDGASVEEGSCWRLETFRSSGSISATAPQQLRCYFVTRCKFVSPPPESATKSSTGAGEEKLGSGAVGGEEGGKKKKKTDIRTVSDQVFLEKASENTLEIYQRIMWNVESRYGPVIEVFEVEGTRERRMVIGYKMGGTTHLFRWVALRSQTCSVYVGADFRIAVHCRTSITSIRSTRRGNTSVRPIQSISPLIATPPFTHSLTLISPPYISQNNSPTA